jgi:hypothetical protein
MLNATGANTEKMMNEKWTLLFAIFLPRRVTTAITNPFMVLSLFVRVRWRKKIELLERKNDE